MRKLVEMVGFTLGSALLLQLAIELGTLAAALVYALFVYLLIGSWYVYRHLGHPKPEHLSQYIGQALSWPTHWRKP